MADQESRRRAIERAAKIVATGPGWVRRAGSTTYEDGVYEVCDLCRGTGNIGSHLCPDCFGKCIVPHECPK